MIIYTYIHTHTHIIIVLSVSSYYFIPILHIRKQTQRGEPTQPRSSAGKCQTGTIYLFIYLFLAVLGLCFCVRAFSSCGKRGGHSSSRCAGLSLSRPLLLRSTGSRRTGSVIVAHVPSCSAACGIFPDQGSNPRPLNWQADSQPLPHQGSSKLVLFSVCLSPRPTFLSINHTASCIMRYQLRIL